LPAPQARIRDFSEATVKTYNHLFAQVCAFNNLWAAFHQARKGKRGKHAVAAFEYQLERNLFTLERELSDGSYRPGRYHHFYIFEPKKRKISAAPFRDRVVHHALCNVIEPIFESRFSDASFACRIGKGTHRALDRAQHFARRYRYVLQGASSDPGRGSLRPKNTAPRQGYSGGHNHCAPVGRAASRIST
jgi:hypothetical protein